MQYFFKKISPKKVYNLKKYIVYRVFSKKAINAESIEKISKIINARPYSDEFNKYMHYSAVFYRSGFNSPWSSKTKDILDSFILIVVFSLLIFIYLPIQKLANILPSTSSFVISPVISAKC